MQTLHRKVLLSRRFTQFWVVLLDKQCRTLSQPEIEKIHFSTIACNCSPHILGCFCLHETMMLLIILPLCNLSDLIWFLSIWLFIGFLSVILFALNASLYFSFIFFTIKQVVTYNKSCHQINNCTDKMHQSIKRSGIASVWRWRCCSCGEEVWIFKIVVFLCVSYLNQHIQWMMWSVWTLPWPHFHLSPFLSLFSQI